jgi:hypothetical protein
MNGNKRCPRGGFLFFLNSQVIWRPSLPQRSGGKKIHFSFGVSFVGVLTKSFSFARYVDSLSKNR